MRKYECEMIGALIPDYSDGVLGAEEAKAVERHIAECVECRAELDNYRRAAELVKLAKYEPPADLAEKVKNKIDRYNRIRKIRNGILRYGGVAAAAAVVLTVTLRALPATMNAAAKASVAGADASAAGAGEAFKYADGTAPETMQETSPAAEYDIFGGMSDEDYSAEQPMLSSLFAAAAPAAGVLADGAPAEEGVPTEEQAIPEAEEFTENEVYGGSPIPSPAAAMQASGAAPVQKSANADSGAAPLILRSAEDAEYLLSNYAPEYIGNADAVYTAAYNIDDNAELIAGFEKIDREGYTIYVSQNVDAIKNAAANSTAPGSGAASNVVIIEFDEGNGDF